MNVIKLNYTLLLQRHKNSLELKSSFFFNILETIADNL